MPSKVDSVVPKSAAAKAGILPGDKILGFNGKTFNTVNDFNQARGTLDDVLSSCSHADSLRLRNATLIVQHAQTGTIDTVKVQLDKDYMLGVAWYNPFKSEYKEVTRTFGFFESIPAGFSHGWKVLAGYVDDLKYLFTADGAKSVGCLLYTSPSPRDRQKSRMPSSA